MRQLAVSVVLLTAASCSSKSSSTTADAPAITGDQYALQWGPIAVAPNTENTQCIDVKLSNTAEIKVHQLHNLLSPGSHHVIVYRNDDPAAVEKTTPYDCKPFTGALNATGMVAPMMITQKADDLLTLPNQVAYTLKANQMVRIEMHYINTGDAPLQVMANVNFYSADPATIKNEANILFIGSPDISIGAHQTATLEQFFAPSRTNLDLSDVTFFAITGHEHQFGTNVTVGTGATKGGPFTPVYTPNPFVWSEPVTQTNNFKLPAGGGLDFKCEWNNTSGSPVGFGESAKDEMCFFWAYYYPSKGAFVCVHSDNYGGVDLCCPGNSLCSQILK